MRECANCHTQNSDESMFCADCGGLLTTTAGEGRPFAAPPTGMYGQSSQGTNTAEAGYYHQPYCQPAPIPVAGIDQNGKAIASLALGILGIISLPIIPSIIAIVLGYGARREIAESRGWQTGDALARAGVIIGWAGMALYLALFLLIAILAALGL